MFRRTEPQLSLLESRFLVSPKKRERLERSWAEAFRQHVLPKINEEEFRACFCENNGRPNKSIRLLVGMHLLKEADDLTDQQILDAIEFNIQWQHALGVEPADAHVCEKTLHNFRDKLATDERAQKVFESLTAALMVADGLSAVRQRLDSTHVISNIKLLTRLGLFTETIAVFLRQLRKEAPEKLAKLDTGYAKRYLDREGYFADAKREQAQRRLPIVARDLYALVRAFELDDIVKVWPSYALLARLLADQCDVSCEEGAEAPVTLKEPVDIAGTSLQSPHDPDATYGHKGKGYETQLAETCVKDNPYQVITGVQVTAANASDQHALMPMIEQLEAAGHKPEVMITDTSYSGGENIVQCAVMGVHLLAPVQDPAKPLSPEHWERPVEAAPPSTTFSDAETSTAPAEPEPAAVPPSPEHSEEPVETAPTSATTLDAVTPKSDPATAGVDSFKFNEVFDTVLACPKGHAPIRQGAMEVAPGFKATFSGIYCTSCPLMERCATGSRAGTDDRVLRWRDNKAATATRQREQQKPAFKQDYKLRSGIESTNAEIKGRHGARDLRMRGRPRVEIAMLLKATALNAKRAVQYHVEAFLSHAHEAADAERVA